MEINQKIKKLRTQQGTTQEKLAEYLGISSQAVSKWETEIASPDISLLPKLSAFFGVTIDELFTLSDDTHFERIENMLNTERDWSIQDETYAKNYLIEQLEHPKQEERATALLASFYLKKAEAARKKAFLYAEKSLNYNPNKKNYHVFLIESLQGVFTDWNYHNHHTLCSFYENFTHLHPQDERGHMYYLDHLLADSRIEEAKKALTSLKKVARPFIGLWYEGRIQKALGFLEEANKTFDKMVECDSKNWQTWATRADEYARIAKYEDAISCNLKALELQPKPRYYDASECMAHIYEIQKQYDQAISMHKLSLSILKEEWNITFGYQIDEIHREIERLEALKAKELYMV